MAIRLTIPHASLLAIIFAGSFVETFSAGKESITREMFKDKIIRLGHPMQYKRTDPSQAVQLSWRPRVFLYRDFLSDEECDYLISWAHEKKSYAMQDNDLPKIRMNNMPEDFKIYIDADDEIARRIEERIFAWTYLPKENSKPLQVLHFGPEDSKQKFNYFNRKTAEQVHQTLVATVILYLSNVSEGGQILFPQSDGKMWSDCTKTSNILRPSKGNAIVFFNVHVNATPDTRSFHARCPVIQGDLWCATKLFYLKNVSTEKDLSESDDADCTDEDENCSSWAATGECQRNSVFMIGSPDYYGTCRKSCNAC